MATAPSSERILWMGQVPPHWEVKALKFCADLVTDRVDGAGIDTDYIGLEHIESRTGRLVRLDGSQESAESTVNRFCSGDVLFGKLRPYLAKATVAGTNGVCSSEILVYRPHGLTPEYLKRVMLLDGFIEEVNSSTYGSKMPRADASFVSRLAVPCPPLSEQLAIASYLDAETARIDEMLSQKRSLLSVLEELRSATVTQAVTAGLTQDVLTSDQALGWLSSMPSHWRAMAIKRLVTSMVYGGSDATDDVGAIRVLTMAHISHGEISTDSNQFWMSVPESLLLEQHDLLFNRTNSPALVGKVGIFRGTRDDRISFASYLVRLRLGHQHDPRWLNYVLNCDPFIAFARGHALVSINQANLNSSKYGRFLVPVPPLPEQAAIADYLDSEIAKIDAVKRHVSSEIDLLLELRSVTVTDAVLGRVDVHSLTKHETGSGAIA